MSDFDPDLPIHDEARIVASLSANPTPLFVRGLRELAWKGERLRKRNENGCNYAWATTDSYEAGTDMIAQAIVALARDCGLHCYLQTDPRGAPVYVSREPIAENRYSTDAICIQMGGS